MGYDLFSDDLIRGIRRLASIPQASDFTDSDLLELADEEQVTIISDRIKAIRGEHWVVYEDMVLTGETRYNIPRRAMGRMVRGISLISTSNVTFSCPQIDPVLGWEGSSSSGITSYCYFFASDQICFPAAPPAGWTMRVWYLRRPSKLVLKSAASGLLQANSPTALLLQDPGTAFQKGDLVDIVKGDTPYDLLYQDLIVLLNPALNIVTLDPTTPVEVSKISAFGINNRQDWLCLRDQTVFPQIPAEFFPVLMAAVGLRYAEAIGDNQLSTLMADTLERRKRTAGDIIDPRNEQGSRPIVRRFSPLRSGGGFGRRWRG